MTISNRFVAIVAAIVLTCAPTTAQKISSLPAASTPAATDQALVIQGAGCAGSSGSCTTARMSLAQIGGYVARDPSVTAAYQPADADLSAIAALSTQPFGRARLTDPDAATARNALGLGSNAIDSTARAPAARMIATTAPLLGGGDLSSDRTLSITAATPSAAGSMSAADKAKLDAIAGTNTGDQTSVSGNAGTATRWQTARTVTIAGDIGWSLSLDGSANVAATATLPNVNASPGTVGSASIVPVISTNAKGQVTAVSSAALATVAATGLDTDLAGSAWPKVTATVFGNGGSLSGATANVRYKQIGKTVFIRVRVNLSSGSTCSGCTDIRVVLPITPATTDTGDQTIIFGRESAQVGFGLQGIIPSGLAQVIITKAADNSYPGGASYNLQLAGFYEAA